MIFNDYDETGHRVNCVGSRSHRTADEAILRNVRFAFPKETAGMSDQAVVNAYDEFAMSELFGNNDERFPEFLSSWEAPE